MERRRSFNMVRAIACGLATAAAAFVLHTPTASALELLPETTPTQAPEFDYETKGRTIQLTKPLRVQNIARNFIPSIPDVTFSYDIAYDANTGDKKDIIQVDASGYILDDYDSRYTPVAHGTDEYGTKFDIWRGPYGGVTISSVTFSHEDDFDPTSNDTVTKRITVQIAGGDDASQQLFKRAGVYRYALVENKMQEVDFGEADITAANVTGNNESGVNLEDVDSDITFNRTLGVSSYGTATVSVVTQDPIDEFSEPYIARIWQENADDNDYTMCEELTMTKLKGAPLNNDLLKSVFNKDRYPGFHLNGTGAKQNDAAFKDDRAPFNIGSEHGIPVVDVYYSRNTYTLSFRFDKSISNPSNIDTTDGIQAGTKLNNANYNKAISDVGYGDLFSTKTTVKYGQNMYQGVYLKGPSSEKIRAFMDGGAYGWSFWATWRGNNWQTVFNAGNPTLTFNPGGKEDGAQVLCLIKNNTKIYAYTVVHHFDNDFTEEWTAYYDEFHTHRFTYGSVMKGYKLIKVEGYNTGFDNSQGRLEDPKQISENEYQYYFKGTTKTGFEPIHVYYEKLPENTGGGSFQIDGSGSGIVDGDTASMELRFLDVYVEWNDYGDGFVIKDVVLHDIADDVDFSTYGNYAVTGEDGSPDTDGFGKKAGFSESVYTTYDLVIGKEIMGKGLTKYDIWDREFKYDVTIHGPAFMEIGNVRKIAGNYADAGRLTLDANGVLHTQVEVHHGEYVILSGLPSGCTYEVEEINNEKDSINGQPDTLDVFGAMIYYTSELSDILVTATGDAGMLADQNARNVRMMELQSLLEQAIAEGNDFQGLIKDRSTGLQTIYKKKAEDNANHVFYMNLRMDSVQTGVSKSVTPYILMVAAALLVIGGVVGVVIFKRRNAYEDDDED